MRKLLPALLAVGLFGQALFAQGDNPRAKPTDWEEINFEYNEAVLVDGFPGMLRLADLLKANPGYKVTLVGNTDQIGSDRYNDELSLKRANAVAQFLQKYGAGSGQITARGDGKKNLEVNDRGVNPRFMNRRVVVTVTAPDGTVIGDGSLTRVVNDFEVYARGQLGKIDGILSQLQQLEAQVRALNTAEIKADTNTIKGDTAAIRRDTAIIPSIKADTTELVARNRPLTADQATQIATKAAQDAANYALTQAALRNKKYALIGMDFGPAFGGGRTGNFTTDLYGKFLVPFSNGKTADQPGTHALQIDGSWDYFHKRKNRPDGVSDGIFDIGVVNRFNKVQLGTFAQFDYATFNQYQGGGLLGAGILTVDYIFNGGKIGLFAAKGFREYANVGTSDLTARLTPAYVRYDDQIGFAATGAIGKHWILDSDVAFKKRYARGLSKLPSGSMKLSMPVNDMVSVYAQLAQNYTFQNLTTGYRLVFGIQIGNWLRPSEYSSTTGVIPVDVPRPHYELLKR